MATGRRDDREYRRRIGRQEIKRASAGFKRLETDLERARNRLYSTMRAYADVFTEEELVGLGPVSRPTVRKRVLGKDDAREESRTSDPVGPHAEDTPNALGGAPDEDPQNGADED